MKKRNCNKGFSLVELIVVVLIMAIIAVVLAPQVTKWVQSSRQSSDLQTMDSLTEFAHLAMTDSDAYAESAGGIEIKVDKNSTVIKSDTNAIPNFVEKVAEYAGIPMSDFSSTDGGKTYTTDAIKAKADGTVIKIDAEKGNVIPTSNIDNSDLEVAKTNNETTGNPVINGGGGTTPGGSGENGGGTTPGGSGENGGGTTPGRSSESPLTEITVKHLFSEGSKTTIIYSEKVNKSNGVFTSTMTFANLTTSDSNVFTGNEDKYEIVWTAGNSDVKFGGKLSVGFNTTAYADTPENRADHKKYYYDELAPKSIKINGVVYPVFENGYTPDSKIEYYCDDYQSGGLFAAKEVKDVNGTYYLLTEFYSYPSTYYSADSGHWCWKTTGRTLKVYIKKL